MVKHLDAAFARIWTRNASAEMLELQASSGMHTHLNGPHSRVPVGTLKIGLIARQRAPHPTNSVIGDPRVGDQGWAKREGMVAFAGYPLLVEGKMVGVVALFARHSLSEATLDALSSVSDAIALGIERKRAEEKLRLQGAALDAAANLIIITDRDGAIQWVNPALSAVTGYNFEEAIGKNPRDLLKSGKHDPAYDRNLWDTILAGEVWHDEIINRRKNGSLYTEALTITPVRSYHGLIQVNSQQGQGTQFRVYLPVCGSATAVEAPAVASVPSLGQGELVLVVDDEDGVRGVTRSILEKNGYRCAEAQNGVEALTVIVSQSSEVKVVVTDLMMPYMDGAAFIRALSHTKSTVKVIVTTGNPSKSRLLDELRAQVQGFLPKPFRADALLEMVHLVLHPQESVPAREPKRE